MKRPTFVRVLGKRIAIKFVPAGAPELRDNPEDDDPGLGRSDGARQLVAIEEGQPLGYEQDTVLHEIMHIIEEYNGLDVNEEYIEKIASGLLAVLKDNPSFVSYLRQREK